MASLDLRLGLAPIVVMTACATSVPAEDASAPPIATQQQALAEAPAAPAPVAEPEPEALDIPSDCPDAEATLCTPPEAFVEQLCRGARPDVALALFKKGSPWKRAYMRGQVEAWYAGSGRSTPQILRPLEEVIVLRSRAGGGGAVKVTGSGSYDVYRWNGRCVSVMEGELSLKNPGTADVALIPWRALAPPIQDKLSEDQHIKTHNERRRDACREDRDSAKCDHASLGLSRRIAQYVRDGHPLPVPTSLGRPGQ